MPGFRLVHVGEDREPFFVCNRCSITISDSSFPTSEQQNYKIVRSSGECLSCKGKGYTPNQHTQTCRECGGSGICPQCAGNPAREWESLPRHERMKWKSKLDISSKRQTERPLKEGLSGFGRIA